MSNIYLRIREFLQQMLSWALSAHGWVPRCICWWCRWCSNWSCFCSWFPSSLSNFSCVLRAHHISNELPLIFKLCDCACILVVPHILHQLRSLFYAPGTALDLVSMHNSSCAVFGGNSKSELNQEGICGSRLRLSTSEQNGRRWRTIQMESGEQ